MTNFTSGNAQTFPMFIYAKNRVGVPVQVNVIGTIIFVVAVGRRAPDRRIARRAAAPSRRRRTPP